MTKRERQIDSLYWELRDKVHGWTIQTNDNHELAELIKLVLENGSGLQRDEMYSVIKRLYTVFSEGNPLADNLIDLEQVNEALKEHYDNSYKEIASSL